MGYKYEYGNNPFTDVLVNMLEYDIDISTTKNVSEIDKKFTTIIQNEINDPNVESFVDFDIKNDDNFFTVIPNNTPTAMWLSNVLIDDINILTTNNKFAVGDKLYVYNKKTKKLTIKKYNNEQ